MTFEKVGKPLAGLTILLVTVFSLYVYAQSNSELTRSVPNVEFGTAQIALADVILDLEYAHNFEQRARGLMYRNSLCEDCGMLFEFDYVRRAGFWMKNTLIPLDIAYIDSDGTIADIKPMYPLVLEPVPSSRAVLYALEMNQGWFKKQGIRVGDKMQIIKRSELE